MAGLLHDGSARQALGHEQLAVPHLIDSELASGVRRLVLAGRLEAKSGWAALETWRRLGLTRYSLHPMLERIWALRENLSSYDAGYVALAEELDCSLVTADSRLSGAPGLKCPVTVVPG